MDIKSEVENGIKESGLITNFFKGIQTHWKVTLAVVLFLFLVIWFTPMDDEEDSVVMGQEIELTEEAPADGTDTLKK